MQVIFRRCLSPPHTLAVSSLLGLGTFFRYRYLYTEVISLVLIPADNQQMMMPRGVWCVLLFSTMASGEMMLLLEGAVQGAAPRGSPTAHFAFHFLQTPVGLPEPSSSLCFAQAAEDITSKARMMELSLTLDSTQWTIVSLLQPAQTHKPLVSGVHVSFFRLLFSQTNIYFGESRGNPILYLWFRFLLSATCSAREVMHSGFFFKFASGSARRWVAGHLEVNKHKQ